MRILAVDNEPLILRSLRRYLALRGHDVATALSGEEALARLAGPETFDLVITDVDMPGMDGFALRQAILCGYPGLPVLLASGSPRAMEAALQLGLPFLSKPWSAEDLDTVLAQVAADEAAARLP